MACIEFDRAGRAGPSPEAGVVPEMFPPDPALLLRSLNPVAPGSAARGVVDRAAIGPYHQRDARTSEVSRRLTVR